MSTMFPAGFRLGVATSAYQIEGATEEDGRGPSDWDAFAATPGAIYRGDTARIAADHYHRYEDDLDLMQELGVDAYRLSLSWTRVYPDGSTRNEAGLDFYDRLIDAALSRGIEPFVTINHMEVPLELAKDGGWLNRSTIDRYVEYADTVHGRLADRVSQWMTMNEVPVTTWWGHGTSWFPPAHGDARLVLPAIHNQMVAHGRAVRLLRERQPAGTFGIVGSYWPVRPASDSFEDAADAHLLDLLINRSGLDVLVNGAWSRELTEWHASIGGKPFVEDGDLIDVAQPLDAYGVNYYAPVWVAHDDSGPGGAVIPPGIGMRQADPVELPRTAFNWVIDPAGLTEVLRLFRDRYRLPVYITENGCAVDDYVDPEGRVNDVERIEYVSAHLDAIAVAIAEGVQVRGYFLWSMLDNFEWASGYSKRFGLTFVDYATQRRIPKASSAWYSALIDRERAGITSEHARSPLTPASR